MEPVTCSTASAASATGVCRATIYAWMRQGKIETVRIGGRRLVKIESIRRLVDAA